MEEGHAIRVAFAPLHENYTSVIADELDMPLRFRSASRNMQNQKLEGFRCSIEIWGRSPVWKLLDVGELLTDFRPSWIRNVTSGIDTQA